LNIFDLVKIFDKFFYQIFDLTDLVKKSLLFFLPNPDSEIFGKKVRCRYPAGDSLLIFPGSDLVKAPQEPAFEFRDGRCDLLIISMLQAFAFNEIIVGSKLRLAGAVVYGNEAGAGKDQEILVDGKFNFANDRYFDCIYIFSDRTSDGILLGG